jgi:hypothetical protein
MKLTAALALALASLALAPAAVASNDPLGGGATGLVLDRSFLGFLRQAGVTLAATAPARRAGRKLTLPVSGGSIDPTLGRGEVETAGALVLKSARKRVPLRALAVKTTHSPLIAKVGGSQLKVATAAKIGSRRHGFGSLFIAKPLKLTAKVATRLNKKLRPLLPFRAGQILGRLRSAPVPSSVAILPSGRATLVFDSAFLAKLDQHFVSVNPIFPAEHAGPAFTLPIIAGGALAPEASSGTLRSGGAIEFLQLGAGQIFWREPWFDLGLRLALAEADLEPAPPFAGKLGQIGVLDLGAGATSSEPEARTIALAGAPLALPAATADAFNRAFAEGREDFHAGELLGTLSFSAQGQ